MTTINYLAKTVMDFDEYFKPGIATINDTECILLAGPNGTKLKLIGNFDIGTNTGPVTGFVVLSSVNTKLIASDPSTPTSFLLQTILGMSSSLDIAEYLLGGGDTHKGSAQEDKIEGFDGNDTIFGGAGQDRVEAGEGDDFVDGGTGADVLYGGMGNDTLVWDDPSDFVYGGQDNDTIRVDAGAAKGEFHGGAGLDTLLVAKSLSLGAVTLDSIERIKLQGTITFACSQPLSVDDTNLEIIGDALANTISFKLVSPGGKGPATLNLSGYTFTDWSTDDVVKVTGTASGDTIRGGVVSTIIDGGAGDDLLVGNGAADMITGGEGADTLVGGAGDDTYVVDAADTIFEAAGGGNDLVYTAGSFSLAGFANVERLTLEVGAGSAELTGNALANAIIGAVGNDILDGGAGADTLTGGTGNDTYIADSLDTIVETAGGGLDTVFARGSVSLATFEQVENLAMADAAAATNARLTGNALANTLAGGAGKNILDGGAGKDVLTGGLGKDIFLFNAALSATTNVDVIKDYRRIDDTIRLENKFFKALTHTGTLAKSAFYVGTKAHDADDRIIYNRDKGVLYYDPDGLGGAAQIKFALLANKASLNYAEFVVV